MPGPNRGITWRTFRPVEHRAFTPFLLIFLALKAFITSPSILHFAVSNAKVKAPSSGSSQQQQEPLSPTVPIGQHADKHTEPSYYTEMIKGRKSIQERSYWSK
jgi:hypothetical protein